MLIRVVSITSSKWCPSASLLNDEIKKVYLGDIELVLQGYYGKMLLIFLQYVKYVGVGEFREYGFGEIISRS